MGAAIVFEHKTPAQLINQTRSINQLRHTACKWALRRVQELLAMQEQLESLNKQIKPIIQITRKLRQMAKHSGGLHEGDGLTQDCETIVNNPSEQGWEHMQAWHQWLAKQARQATKEHQQTNLEEWTSLVEEAVLKKLCSCFQTCKRTTGTSQRVHTR
jgi:hypothetical protein